MRLHPALLLAALVGLPGPALGQSCTGLPTDVFNYDPRTPLELRDSLLAVRDSVAVHAISFAGPRGGRVTGYLFVPVWKVGAAKFPGVVVQHGMPGNARAVYRDAGNIARHGAVTIALDAPWNAREGQPVEFGPRDSVEQVQLIVNLRRAFDLVAARPDVDPARLGYTGRSYGGAMGGLLAGVEHRPVTYVLVVGDGGLVSHFTDARGEMDLAPFGGQLTVANAGRWLAAMRPIEPIRFLPCATSRLLFLNGRSDALVTVEDATAYQTAGPEPKTIKWYDAGHGLNQAARVDELTWLHETLGTQPPRDPATWWSFRP